MPAFRKYTSEVEAVQLTNSNYAEVSRWCNGKVTKKPHHAFKDGERVTEIKVHMTLPCGSSKALQVASEGMWICRSPNGIFRIYTNTLFLEMFKPGRRIVE